MRVLLALSLVLTVACAGLGDPTTAPTSDVTTEAAPPPVPAEAAEAAPKAASAAAPKAEFTVDQMPDDLRSGSPGAREDALVRHEPDAAMTAAIVWVMKNDSDERVRFKAWRVVRARWKRGTGATAEHEAAAVWAAANADEDTRVEALAALGERGRSLNAPAKHLADPSDRVRIAAGAAVFEVGGRTGKRTDAKKLLAARRDVESVGAVRKRLAGWIDEL